MKYNALSEFRNFAVKGRRITSIALDRYIGHMARPRSDSKISPMIIEEREMNVAQMDVFSRLMADRIIFLGTVINDEVSNIVTAQLLFLESTDNAHDIKIYLNTPGGDVISGYAIIDTMDYVKPDVGIVVAGCALSMGFVIAACGAKGKRISLQHSKFMLHQPLGGMVGDATEVAIYNTEMQKYKMELAGILSTRTGRSIDQVLIDMDRDKWLTSEEAKEYGAIDKILTR